MLVAAGQFSADEAVPGLMARHILAGEFPAFYWGQDYFGAAEEYEIAALFAIAGWSPWLVFVPALLASSLLVLLTWSLARWIGPSPAGLIAAVPMAIAPPVLSRTLASASGGFALSFALILGGWWCLRRLWIGPSDIPHAAIWVAAFALVTGVAIWTWQPALVALPPLLLIALLRQPRLRHSPWLLLSVAPVLIGLAPPLVYNARNGWPTVSSMLRKAGDAQPSAATPLDQLHVVGSLLFLALGGGDDSVGGANMLQGGLLAGAMLFVPVVCVVLALKYPTTCWRKRALGVSLVVVGAAMHTLAAYEVTRYFVPVIATACVLFGVGVAALPGRFKILGYIALLALVATNLVEYARTAELLAGPDLGSISETQTALAALQQRNLQTGYADYWAAYPLTYLSGERIIVAPQLPFLWRARTDRYPPYTQQVDAVTDPNRIFALVDQRCALEPIVSPLDAAGATYQLDPVARWTLVWDVQVPAQQAAATLTAWRAAIEQANC